MAYRALIPLALLILFSLLAPLLAPFPTDYSEKIITIEKDGTEDYLFSPHKPSLRHPFGTDRWGHDLLSQMLHGMRFTVLFSLLVALFQTLLGLLFGLSRAFRGKTFFRELNFFSAIPPFILVYFLFFSINFNSPAPTWLLTLLQGIVLILVGLGPLVTFFQKRGDFLLNQTFIEAARSIGASNVRIITHHLISDLREDFFISFTQSLVSLLTLIGQMGIFDLFIGGTIVARNPPLYHSVTHEWLGLIAQNKDSLNGSNLHLIIFPLAGYLLIFTTALMTEKRLLKKQQSGHKKTSGSVPEAPII